MKMSEISKGIRYIGVDDKDLDLFEGQYPIPNGIAYNSYLILDDKIAVMDTVDHRKTTEFLANLEDALGGRKPDYLVVHHVEPDHASSMQDFLEKYPDTIVVASTKALQMLPLFNSFPTHTEAIKEGDVLELGHHTLHFIAAPMVHWPEVMMSYESSDKVLFSADAFGKFGSLDTEEDWDCEARRYYFNIVGKYGPQVQAVLKKAASLDIHTICPLHGPALKENLGHYLDKYQVWSSYSVESDGVFIACASLHGNTFAAAKKLKDFLEQKGCPKVTLTDLARDDSSEALEDAFRYGKVVLCASSYNAGVVPCMEDFLHHLKGKNYQNRTVALIENGSWAPSAAKTMRGILEQMKGISILDPVVTLRGALKETDLPVLETLAGSLI